LTEPHTRLHGIKKDGSAVPGEAVVPEQTPDRLCRVMEAAKLVAQWQQAPWRLSPPCPAARSLRIKRGCTCSLLAWCVPDVTSVRHSICNKKGDVKTVTIKYLSRLLV